MVWYHVKPIRQVVKMYRTKHDLKFRVRRVLRNRKGLLKMAGGRPQFKVLIEGAMLTQETELCQVGKIYADQRTPKREIAAFMALI